MKLAIILSLFMAAASAEVHSQCKSAGMFAMTFDDGPSKDTAALLKHLEDKKVHATFHLSTQNLTDPEVQSMVRRISKAGHLVGTRTEINWDLDKMSNDQIASAVARQSNILAQFVGYHPKLFRVPYGKSKGKVQAAIEGAGGIITVHNLEAYDFTKDQGRIKSAFNLAMGLKSAGSSSFISIQHDTIPSSVAATPDIIDSIRKSGYKLVKLDECIGAGDLTKNKTALKGGKDDGQIPTLDGASGDAPDISDQTGSSGGKNKDLLGLSAGATVYVPVGFFAAALLLLQVIF